MTKKVVAIILARGGSKGIPKKNVLNFWVVCYSVSIQFLCAPGMAMKAALPNVTIMCHNDELSSTMS